MKKKTEHQNKVMPSAMQLQLVPKNERVRER